MTNQPTNQTDAENAAKRALFQEALKNKTFYKMSGQMIHDAIAAMMKTPPAMIEDVVAMLESNHHNDTADVAPSVLKVIADTFKAYAEVLTIFHDKIRPINDGAAGATIEQAAFELARFMKQNPNPTNQPTDQPTKNDQTN
jgi:hypothetical protein